MKKKDILEEWAKGEFDEDRLLELKQQFPEADELKEAEQIIASANQLDPKLKHDNEDLWLSIDDKISRSRNVVPIFWGNKTWLGLAASITLILAVLILFKPFDKQSEITFLSAIGEKRTVEFPDGSRAYLNASSKVSYNESSWGTARNVSMVGEVFFDVLAGNKFTVTTPTGIISVLGTSFNIKFRAAVLEVKCKSGKVAVESDGVESVLEPGDFVIFNDSGIMEKGRQEVVGIDAWRSGLFTFRNSPAAEVFKEVERQFGYQITVDDALPDSVLYNGFFNNTNIQDALRNVCLPLGLTYTVNEADKTARVRR